MDNIEQRTDYLKRWAALKTERSSWDAHWKDLSEQFMPRAGRFQTTDRNRGDKRHNAIIDNTGLLAKGTLGSGLMAGMSSPARPWFKMATPDQDLNKYGPVKLWLDAVTKQMLRVFHKSNVYRVLHTGYEELGVFGTWTCINQRDYRNVIHLHPMTIGEFCVATNWRGEVDCLYREFEVTVRQMVIEFGLENCSNTVKGMYQRKLLDAWVPLLHCIEPRYNRDPTKRDSLNMPYASVYYERDSNNGKPLRTSGYKKFRGLAARWAVAGGDVYGHSPGMDALGDSKQLQHQQLRKGQGIDYMVLPPVQAPRGSVIDTLPGGTSYVDMAGPGAGIRTAFDVNLRLDYLLEDIRDVRDRVDKAFHTNLFLMLANSTNPQMTATEVAERHEEKMLMLGPVLERLTSELHVPLIDDTFDALMEAGTLPPPPDELQDMDLNVEFVSMLAQAQRAIATNGVDRWVANLGQIASMKPEVLDKLDADKWADEYADMLGVSPSIIVADDKVAIVRKARAQAAQAQAQAEQLAQASQTAKNMGQTPTDGGNLASDVMGLFSGYGTPVGA